MTTTRSTIAIPRHDQVARISGGPLTANPPPALNSEAIMAPDAPMIGADGSTNIPVEPSAPNSTHDFLSSVRELNESKEKKRTPDSQASEDRETGEAKPDITPQVFKDAGTTKPTEKESEDDPELDGIVDPIGDVEVPKKKTKEDSFKDIKTQLSHSRNRETQLSTRVSELEAENNRLKGLETRGEELEQLQTRVKELEGYERVLDIYNNPEFQQKYVQRDAALLNDAKQIAAQYKVAPEVIEQAVKIGNRAEMNEYLRKNGFKDDLGIQDVRPHILQLQQLRAERAQLEKNPEQAREELTRMYNQSEEQRLGTLQRTVEERGESMWNQAVGFYSRSEYSIEQFKEKPGDPDHTALRDATMIRGRQAFINVRNGLLQTGLRDMPREILRDIAMNYYAAAWTGTLAKENISLKDQVAELTQELRAQRSYERPGFTGPGSGGRGAEESTPKGSQAISEHVFMKSRDKVMNGSQQR